MLTEATALRKDKAQRTNPKMQHRHYAFIAATIAAMPDHAPSLRAQKGSVAAAFCAACRGSNPKFDCARFMRACGEE